MQALPRLPSFLMQNTEEEVGELVGRLVALRLSGYPPRSFSLLLSLRRLPAQSVSLSVCPEVRGGGSQK